jgi:hypothetical protein
MSGARFNGAHFLTTIILTHVHQSVAYPFPRHRAKFAADPACRPHQRKELPLLKQPVKVGAKLNR